MTAGDVHVRVRVGIEIYALPVGNVLEVTELGDLTNVPGAGAAVLGVRNLNGQVLPVFDLARVLDIPRDGLAPRIVVADCDGCLAGLAVDEVTDVSPLAADRQDVEAEYLTYAVLEAGRLVGVIDLDRVFEVLGQVAA
jgi:chemotaxis signal transduction protein